MWHIPACSVPMDKKASRYSDRAITISSQKVSIFAGQTQVVLPVMCANTFLGNKEAKKSKGKIREWQVKCRREGFTCGRPSSQGANRDSFAYPFINRSRLSHLLPHTGTYLTGTHSLRQTATILAHFCPSYTANNERQSLWQSLCVYWCSQQGTN